MKFNFQPIHKSFKKDNFDCGIEELNTYLKKYASQNDRKNISKTFIATKEKENIVLGYYSVSMAEIEFDTLPVIYKNRLPRYPIPAMRIGRLAVDKKSQGQNLGEELLIHALKNAVNISSSVGLFAVIVDAKNENAVKFYKRYGFILFGKQSSLFLPIKTIMDNKWN